MTSGHRGYRGHGVLTASSVKQMHPAVSVHTQGQERTSECPGCRDSAALPPHMDSAPEPEVESVQADASGRAARILCVV